MDDFVIARMEPKDWERVRAVRLRALADTPDAFGTVLADDEARPMSEWRMRLENREVATFLATADGRDVGMVVGARYDRENQDAGLFAMWVAPEARGRRMGASLVDAAIEWAGAAGFRRILLDVGDANTPAIRLYESRGFLPTGVVGSLPPPREHIPEHQREIVFMNA